MFDSDPYKLTYIQKSSPKLSDDFLFAEIYKFFTANKTKYIVRAEMHKHNTLIVKFYPAKYRSLDNKYSLLINNYDAIKVILTCASVITVLLEKYPKSSFAFNASCTIDTIGDRMEGYNKNQDLEYIAI